MRDPLYLTLHESGELARRADALRARLEDCDLCPRRCRVDRLAGEVGECGICDLAVVASAAPHHGEEAPLTGRQGSGTVFFSGCNLGCAFCQNDDISRSDEGHLAEPQKLAAIYLRLQELGCHNLNLVTPTHVVPMAIEALDVAAAEGLRLPLVYNTGGYDDPEVIRALEGVVDIYMPDAKFADPEAAERYCAAPDYPDVNRAVLREMHRQVGELRIDDDGLAWRGLLVRHLVMPEDQAGTAAVLEFIARELSTETYVNLMDQYRPCAGAGRFPQISRRVTTAEMDEARHAARLAGISRLDDRDRLRWVF